MNSRTGDDTLHLCRIVRATPEAVYDYAADLDHLPRWASGLAAGRVRRVGDVLLVDSPMGEVAVRFAPRNDLGVLDDDVTLPSGDVVHNPLRVLPHPGGAEVVFTLRRLATTEDEFERDASTVRSDLDQLAHLVESDVPPTHP